MSDLTLNSSDGVETILLNGEHGNIHLGGAGHDGDLRLKSSDEVETILLNGEHGNIHLGGAGHDGDIFLKNSSDVQTIHLNGESGDIILENADCAEDFDVSEADPIEPGTVLVVDQEESLRRCDAAYDKRVAGVVSGAGGLRPGIILDKKASENNRVPVALMGKVFCKVDAQYSPIEIGDLLTTSPTAGHAMKAEDHFRAFGAVIGKALRPLKEGKGLVPILVALQ